MKRDFGAAGARRVCFVVFDAWKAVAMATGSTIDLRPKAQPLSDAERAKALEGLGFGRVFSEHMVKIVYRDGGWQRGELVPYGPITLDPAASVLHYGQAIFE